MANSPCEGQCAICMEDSDDLTCHKCVTDAVEAEREACAIECDKWAADNRVAFLEQALAAECCARRIRARGERTMDHWVVNGGSDANECGDDQPV